MFTGIISHVGKLAKNQGNTYTFSANQSLVHKLSKGVSVAINGVCLTVVEQPSAKKFSVELMPETTRRTTLGLLKKQDPVNLELPATPQTFLSGHIVQGHVDGVAKVEGIENVGNSKILTIAVSKKLHRYIVEKGAIAVNGISLTVSERAPNTFTVGIIPYTQRHTNLGSVRLGDRVNIEVDIITKYLYSIFVRKQSFFITKS